MIDIELIVQNIEEKIKSLEQLEFNDEQKYHICTPLKAVVVNKLTDFKALSNQTFVVKSENKNVKKLTDLDDKVLESGSKNDELENCSKKTSNLNETESKLSKVDDKIANHGEIRRKSTNTHGSHEKQQKSSEIEDKSIKNINKLNSSNENSQNPITISSSDSSDDDQHASSSKTMQQPINRKFYNYKIKVREDNTSKIANKQNDSNSNIIISEIRSVSDLEKSSSNEYKISDDDKAISPNKAQNIIISEVVSNGNKKFNKVVIQKVPDEKSNKIMIKEIFSGVTHTEVSQKSKLMKKKVDNNRESTAVVGKIVSIKSTNLLQNAQEKLIPRRLSTYQNVFQSSINTQKLSKFEKSPQKMVKNPAAVKNNQQEVEKSQNVVNVSIDSSDSEDLLEIVEDDYENELNADDEAEKSIENRAIIENNAESLLSSEKSIKSLKSTVELVDDSLSHQQTLENTQKSIEKPQKDDKIPLNYQKMLETSQSTVERIKDSLSRQFNAQNDDKVTENQSDNIELLEKLNEDDKTAKNPSNLKELLENPRKSTEISSNHKETIENTPKIGDKVISHQQVMEKLKTTVKNNKSISKKQENTDKTEVKIQKSIENPKMTKENSSSQESLDKINTSLTSSEDSLKITKNSDQTSKIASKSPSNTQKGNKNPSKSDNKPAIILKPLPTLENYLSKEGRPRITIKPLIALQKPSTSEISPEKASFLSNIDKPNTIIRKSSINLDYTPKSSSTNDDSVQSTSKTPENRPTKRKRQINPRYKESEYMLKHTSREFTNAIRSKFPKKSKTNSTEGSQSGNEAIDEIEKVPSPGPYKKTSKEFTCELCYKKFTKLYGLNRHMMIHGGDRIHECYRCDSKFVQRSDLERHLTTHDALQQYQCSQCDKGFKTKKNLRDHELEHLDDTAIQCHPCGLKFRSKKKLRFHNITNHSNLNFKCDYCGKVFALKDYLKCHLKAHVIGGKNYEPKNDREMIKHLQIIRTRKMKLIMKKKIMKMEKKLKKN